MTAPDPIEVLQRRVAALEAEHFAVVEQLRKVSDSAERNANSLDDLEEVLGDVSVTAVEYADAISAAMRQAQLDTETTAPPTPPAASSSGGPAGDQGAGAAHPDMSVLYAWVEHHIAPMVRKTTTTGEGGGLRWCRMWWLHIDAVERFVALYWAFQELSVEDSATWFSVYLRDHVDPHLATLTSPYGPFYACSPRRHSDTGEALGTAEFASHQPEHQP